ncbi:hypothetical protein [Pseudomonas fluorescens]|uniref:hypothetical protein n=1 Tax=Pseudomonas fluorescens TaxID=294 RepID=UPI001146A0A2|nr:hypothetical protein [Pseudomonas fluorescens]
MDPAELAFRGFVWKLSPVYADGVLDKSQRLESIVGETVTIRGSDAAAWLAWLTAQNGTYGKSCVDADQMSEFSPYLGITPLPRRRLSSDLQDLGNSEKDFQLW